jgi:hypothetical protein
MAAKLRTRSPEQTSIVDRDQWLTILEAASRSLPDQLDDHWNWLMGELRLPYDLFPAILVAIQEGRWRTAKNPKNYIKVVARRVAQKIEPIPSDHGLLILIDQPPDGRPFSFDDALAKLDQSGSSEASKRADGVWRRGSGWSDDYSVDEEDRQQGVSHREFLLSYVPSELKHIELPSEEYKAFLEEVNSQFDDHHLHPQAWTRLDWDHWAAIAGFDKWENLVLTCKLNQISRDRAMASQPTEENRRALQAAWRRFDRGGLNRLKEAAKKLQKKFR